jgi:HEAT repeat protein
MGTLVWESGGLPIIMNLLEDGSVDRLLLASVLRTSGEEGEDLLIKILKYHKNYKVRMAAASVCAYRLPLNERQIDVSLTLDANDVV